MIPREDIFRILLIASILSVTQSQNSKSYDTSDWIPLTDKCATCYQDSQQEHVIEKKATSRVLNLAEPDPNKSSFFPQEDKVRTRKSNQEIVPHYFREVSQSGKSLSRIQQDLLPQATVGERSYPTDIRQQLNQGEVVNQHYFKQPTSVREYQKQAQQLPQQIQLNNQPLTQQNPQLLLVPQFPGQEFASQPLLNVPLPTSLYPLNYQNIPTNLQQQNAQGTNKPKLYQTLNPDIQAINHGLSADIPVSNNNNYKDLRQVSLTSTSPKPEVEKETVQLLYVPFESLNQRQHNQKQQNVLVPQQSNVQNQQEAIFRPEDQIKVQDQQQIQTLPVFQEQQFNAGQQFKAQQGQQVTEYGFNQQQADALQKQQEDLIRQLQQEAIRLRQQQALKAIRRQQAIAKQQNALTQQEQLPLANQQIQLIQTPQPRRRPTRPTISPQYETQVSTVQNETPAEHKQQQLQSIQNDFAQQALEALRLQQQFQQGETPEVVPQLSTTTVRPTTSQAAPKKRKPHQPPLAVYMEGAGELSVNDVLNVLKNAKSISVQDTVGPDSPQVFVGPHNLEPPEGYAKFDLPYLSTIESNRVERKVDQLPFFVAPLSYKTPAGYSKIPLPAPHVGSVVVSQGEESHEKHTRQQPPFRLENLFNEDPYRLPNLSPYQVEPQPKPIKPFRLENAINEEPYRLPNQPQAVFDPFSSHLLNPATPSVPVTSRPDLLHQTINQYELEQINNQFLPQSQSQYQSTQLEDEPQNDFDDTANVRQPPTRKSNRVTSTTPPLPASSQSYVTEEPREIKTTAKSVEFRSRNSVRPTQRTSITSTQSNVDKNKYTVLEEFSIQRKPTTTTRANFESVIASSTPNAIPEVYSTNLQHQLQQTPRRLPQPAPQLVQQQLLPSAVSRLVPQSVPQPLQPSQIQHQTLSPEIQQPSYIPNSRQQEIIQQLPDQDALSKQTSQQQHQQQQQQQQTILSNASPEVFNAPAYYHLDSQGRYVPVQDAADDPYKLLHQQAFQQEFQAFRGTGPLISTTTPQVITELISSTPRLTERPTEQSTRANVRNHSRSRSRGRTHYVPEVYQETSEIKDSSNENYKLPQELPAINSGLPGLINNLQDQAIRPLLVPASIAPTTEHVLRSQSSPSPPQHQSQQELEQRHQQVQQQQLQQQQLLLVEQPQPRPQQSQQFAPQQLSQQHLLLQQIPQQEQILLQPQRQHQQLPQQLQPPQLQHQQLPQQLQLHLQQQQLPHQLQPQEQYVLVSSTEDELVTTTPAPITYPTTTTTTAAPTTNRRNRGRQRARVTTTAPSTSSPRRTAQRTRKPASRSRTEQNRYQQELVDEYADYVPVKSVETHTKASVSRHETNYDIDTPRKSSSRQRFRTRGRPVQEVALTERTSTTSSSEDVAFRQPVLQSGFQASSDPQLLPPQSYMQFEQPTDSEQPQAPQVAYVDRDQIIKQYQQVYNLEQQSLSSTEPLPLSDKQEQVDHKKLSVDVLIDHPRTETASRVPEIVSEPEEDPSYVRFNSNNYEATVKPQRKQQIEETTRSSPNSRLRGRGRGRPRVKPTTQKPTTTTVSHLRTTTEEPEEEEFYGFIRPPSFNRPEIVQHQPKISVEEPKLYSATYVSSTGAPLRASNAINYEDQPVENSNNVQVYSSNAVSSTPRLQFVGKIRPKYPAHTTKTEEPIEIATEQITTEKRYTVRTTKPTSKPRIRGRLRVPSKKTYGDSGRAVNQKQHETTTAPETHRFKSRGSSSFKVPERLRSKSEDEDVEGGNYPVPFLKAQEAQETRTERPRFQITIDPALEENLSEEDQLPYSSIYQPKIVRKSGVGKEESHGLSQETALLQNDIPIQRKVVEYQEQLQALPLVSTTEKSFITDDKNDTEIKMTILEEILGDVDESTEDNKSVLNDSKDYLDSQEQDIVTTTTRKPKSRRRGVWKLVKRPVDTFETAESQYVGTVIANSFDISGVKKYSEDIGKGKVHFVNSFTVDEKGKNIYDMGTKEEVATVTPEGKTPTESSTHQVELSSQAPELSSVPASSSTTEESFFDSLYKMFEMEDENQEKVGASKKKQSSNDDLTEIEDDYSKYVEETSKSEHSSETTTEIISSPQQSNVSSSESPNDLLTTPDKNLENVTDTQTPQTEISNLPQLTSDSDLKDSLVEPWNFGEVKTSTSTEVSHETEICYRGRCVKSSGTKIPAL